MAVMFFLLFIPFFASAAPLPWGIAINHETKQCTGYWAGDEFTAYDLPDGWVDYYPNGIDQDLSIIKTQYGECNFSDRYKSEQCCNEIGLVYLEDPGIISRRIEREQVYGDSPKKPFSYFTTISAIILLFLIVGIVGYFSRKRVK